MAAGKTEKDWPERLESFLDREFALVFKRENIVIDREAFLQQWYKAVKLNKVDISNAKLIVKIGCEILKNYASS